MYVVLVVTGRIEVKHAGNVLNVDASRDYVGGDEHAGRPGVEGLQGPVALGLGTAPVQRDGVHTGVDELA